MPELKLESPEIKHTFICDSVIDFDDPLLHNFLQSVESFRSAVPLDKLKLTKNPDDTYDYKCDLADSRVWRQTISFPDGVGSEAATTFNISESWRDSEFLAHRDVRRYLVLLIQQKLLSSLTCNVL